MQNDLWLWKWKIYHQWEAKGRQSLVEGVDSMLHHKNVPLCFWAEAVNTSGYTLNRVATRVLHGKIPLKLWSNQIPDVSSFRTFDSLAYIHIPSKSKRSLIVNQENVRSLVILQGAKLIDYGVMRSVNLLPAGTLFLMRIRFFPVLSLRSNWS